MKLVDGRRPPVEPSRFDHGGWLALVVLATFAVLWAITLAWIWWGGAGPTFIYAEF